MNTSSDRAPTPVTAKAVLPAILLVLSGIMLAGCATSAPQYASAKQPGAYGYNDQQLADDRYLVQFVARSRDVATAREWALLRAAELTLQKGGQWFEVVDRQKDLSPARSGTSVQTGFEQPVTTTRTHCGLLTCTTRTDVSTIGHQTASVRTTEKVTVGLEIVVGQGKMAAGGAYYNAAQTADNLQQKVSNSSSEQQPQGSTG